ncbi:MAG: BlaI/MecI/CopY family transcriptional regulator [Prevotella sp.]|jgi:BlaI family penicillinase repressor
MDKLTKQEEDVMKAIWELGQCGVKEVLELLPEPQPPYTTVASVIAKLKRKNFVLQKKEGKAYIYQPAIAENDYKKRFITGFVRDYFRNSFKEMVTFFAKDEKISEQDLREIIKEIEANNP